ncbi:hypothetical protein Riv7116_5647 [Rivularia sp. PCC 7116]|uniref:hypothetical protein n=1 Tax=Rivularia sp. PCC 7116 TaxID=373994 RepID=UPI00029F1938|nr:hypothetical protein [Rivularia sp. PCC 7116]AFY58015.1 hypothetical protein Riv7116_5647 [Rivularia sp. PCC 7116]
MELISRRRFGQIAIASGATVAIGSLLGKTFAQSPGVVILGITSGTVSSDSANGIDTDDVAESEAAEDSVIENDNNPKKPVVVKSFNVSNGQTKTVTTTQPILERGEFVSGFAVSEAGTLIVATANIAAEKSASNRLITVKGNSVETKEVSGVAKDESLDLIKLPDGSIAGIVKNENGTGSRKIVDVEAESGAVRKRTAPTKIPSRGRLESSNTISAQEPQANRSVAEAEELEAEKIPTLELPTELPSDKEYKNVVVCNDGNSYAFLTDFQGDTSLVNITTGKTIPVTFEGKVWNNGFSGFICAKNNQLYALGGRRYETPKFLHLLDKETGNLKRLAPFDVATITL